MKTIQLERGRRPWEPATSATLVHVLDRYNIPMSGLIEQEGQTYVFTAVVGEVDEDNVWVYAAVTDDELQHLYEARGEQVLDVVDACLVDRWVVVAAAFDFELEVWRKLDAGEEGPSGLVRRFLRQWRRDLAKERQHLARDESKVEVLEHSKALAGV